MGQVLGVVQGLSLNNLRVVLSLRADTRKVDLCHGVLGSWQSVLAEAVTTSSGTSMWGGGGGRVQSVEFRGRPGA